MGHVRSMALGDRVCEGGPGKWFEWGRCEHMGKSVCRVCGSHE